MKKPLHSQMKKMPAAPSRMLAFDPNGFLKLKFGTPIPPLPPPLPPLPPLPPRWEGGGMSVLFGLLAGLVTVAPGFFLPPKMPANLSLKSRHSSSKSGGPSGLVAGGWLLGWVSTGLLVSGSTLGDWSPPCPSLASLDPVLWLLPQPGSLTEKRSRNLRVIRKIASVGNRIKFRRFWSFR